jgi:hypothetical protein
MTTRQRVLACFVRDQIPFENIAFQQQMLRVRYKFTVRTEEDIQTYCTRIMDAVGCLEADNAFIAQRPFPFPSKFEIWFRLTDEAIRILGERPTPESVEAPLVSSVGRIYKVRRKPKGGAIDMAEHRPSGSHATAEHTATEQNVSSDPMADLESMQQDTAGQVASEPTPAPIAEAPVTNGTAPAAPVNTGVVGRPPAVPLPEVVAGSAVDILLKNADISASEKARRLVVDHGYTIANAAKQLSITRGKPMRYQQVYQSLHGKEMRAARDARQAGKTPEEVQAARLAAGQPTPPGTVTPVAATAAAPVTTPETAAAEEVSSTEAPPEEGAAE